MGWTGYHATNYNRRGEIDRRAECDERMSGENEHGKWEILKSTMRGSTYYAAVRRTDKETGESHVFGCVCLTSVDMKDYFNFSYKAMEETMGPGCYDCPASILDLLSPTDNEYALNWRQKCREKKSNKNTLGKLPVGTVIEYALGDQTYRLEKRAPNFQFKTPWWYRAANNTYVPKARIPQTFQVVSA